MIRKLYSVAKYKKFNPPRRALGTRRARNKKPRAVRRCALAGVIAPACAGLLP